MPLLLSELNLQLWPWDRAFRCCGDVQKHNTVKIARSARPHESSGESHRAQSSVATPRPFAVRAQESPALGDDVEQRVISAARAGDLKRMARGIAECGKVHFTTSRGQSLLMLAAGSSNPTAVKAVHFLLEAKVGLEQRDHFGWTALHHACRNSNKSVVRFFIERKALLNACTSSGETALVLAALDGQADILALLLSSKATVEKKDKQGKTALHHACELDKSDLVKLLLKTGAKSNAKAADGTTPLMLAIKNGSREIAEMLMFRLANINAVNSEGDNVLMLGVRIKNISLIKYLLEENAEVNAKNQKDETVLHIARSLGLSKVAELLAARMGVSAMIETY